MKPCRICKGLRLERFLDLGLQPHCNSFLRAEQLQQPEPRWPLDLLYCHDCHLVQLGTVVDREVMFRNYVYVSGTTATLRAHFDQSAEDLIQRFALPREALVLDIGSNDGTFLSCFRSRGVRVLGVDPASNIAAQANAAGIETINDYFSEPVATRVRQERGAASLITACGVFFHIDDMDDVCRGVSALLAPDGVLHVQAIYLGGMLERGLYDQVYHEHVSYYTLHALMNLFPRFGMEIFDVDFSPIHGGSILIYASHRGARPVSPRVARVLADERGKGWDGVAAYHEFAGRVQRNRDALVALIRQRRAAGRRIAAYAAPAKGNTLLNYCGLGPELISYAVEKAPLKIGLFTPGMHIPVIDEADAEANPPDDYLLLAWNFLDELLAKNAAFRARGGRFIIPVPEPHVV
jgi:SAM-dependent methyltransferase